MQDVSKVSNQELFDLLDVTVAEIVNRYGKDEARYALLHRLGGLKAIASIEDLDLSVQAYNVIRRCGIHTLDQLIKSDPRIIRDARNSGPKTWNEIISKLEEKGFTSWGKDLE